MSKDYYSILEIKKDATEDEIKKAFRTLSLIHHPDRNPPDKKEECEVKYKEITEAYSVLGDKDKKRQYDMIGLSSSNHQNFNPFGDGFSEMFNGIFNHMGMNINFGNNNKQIREVYFNIPLTLEEVYSGYTKHKKLKIENDCNDCHSTGKEFFFTCDECNGSGQKRTTQRMGPIITQFLTECGKCKKTGKVGFGENVCKGCDGKTKKDVIVDVEITFPAGVKQDEKFRKNLDEHNLCFVFLAKIEGHNLYTRDGNDLKITKDISLVDALTGLSFELKLLDGREITIKSVDGMIIKPNSIHTLKNLGICGGDLHILFNIIFPYRLEEEEKKELERIFKKEKKVEKEGEIYYL